MWKTISNLPLKALHLLETYLLKGQLAIKVSVNKLALVLNLEGLTEMLETVIF